MTRLVAAFAFLLALPVPQVPGLLTLDSPVPIIDNERVTVYDLTWTRGVPNILERPTADSVWIEVSPSAGAVTYWKKGEARRAPRQASGATRMIAVNFKDHPDTPTPNTSGYPNAFPRPHIKKVLDNDRITVWDYTWTPGEPTPVHFHNKDVVVVYLDRGSLKSTTPDGRSVVSTWKPGDTRFNRRNRVHTETLVDGTLRAVIAELK